MPERRRSANHDLRDQPAYSVAEAARYLRVPAATLRTWTAGRLYPTAKGLKPFQPLFRPAEAAPLTLSFWNLIEAHVIRALRTDHGISVKALRKAITFAEKELGVERLLLRRELSSERGQLFLDRYGELINLSASGQLAMRQLLEAHLKRVRWDENSFPIRLHPFISGVQADDRMPIAIDPEISFGRPIVVSRCISTSAIVERIDAGESIDSVANDYGISASDIRYAVLYERAA